MNNLKKNKTTLTQKILLIILGVILAGACLELGLRLGGYVISSIQDRQNLASLKQKGTFRIMCLGESTTVASPNPYPSQLEEILNKRDIGIKFSVINKGHTSITTAYIVEHLEENLNEVKPDMVVTMMGINDFAQHIPWEYGSLEHRLTFFESLQIYKLVRYLWLRILTKFNNINAQAAYFSFPKCYAEEQSYINSEVLNKNNQGFPVINESEYINKGDAYIHQGRYKEAEIIFKKIVESNPKNYDGYIKLAWAYNRQDKMLDSELTYKKAIKLEPKNISAYLELGLRYSEVGRYKEAEKIFKKAVKLDGLNNRANFYLGWTYKILGKEEEAKECFRRVVTSLHPKNNDPDADRTCGTLAALYRELGQIQMAEEYYGRANSIRLQYYNSFTKKNYLKLKQILDRRGIKLVCVQYPVRSIEPLKRIFSNDPGVIFVDNEQIFKDALSREGYKEYFMDIFGGDFGHCTAKGNHLLAKNVADAILKRYFNK